MVPATTMEEMPVLSDDERAELTTALKEADVHQGRKGRRL
jgi:hypothetical protein